MLLKLSEGEIVEFYSTGELLKLRRDYEIEVTETHDEYKVKIPEFEIYAMNSNLNKLKESILSQLAFYYDYYECICGTTSTEKENKEKVERLLIKEKNRVIF